jgi:protein-tyrosine phosphatase
VVELRALPLEPHLQPSKRKVLKKNYVDFRILYSTRQDQDIFRHIRTLKNHHVFPIPGEHHTSLP